MRNVTLAIAALLFASAVIAEPAAQPAGKGKGTSKEQGPATLKSPQTPSEAGSTGTSSAVDSSISTTASPKSIRESIMGAIDIRPSFDFDVPGRAAYRVENAVELGYRFTKDTSINYEQDFWHLIDDVNDKSGNSKDRINIRDGFFKLKVNNVVKSGGFSLGYESRVYLPTHERKRAQSMITEIRNYAKASYAFTPSFGLTVMSVPVVHLYNRALAKNGVANPAFEHRTVVSADFSFLNGKLSLAVPPILYSHYFRPDAGAANGSKWGHYLEFNPELMYSVSSHLALGVSYYSANLLDADKVPSAGPNLSTFERGLNIGEGLKRGVPQLALRATL